MGAHTLGNCDTDASGYRGVWIGGQSTDFNNVYYKYLTGEVAGVSYENRVLLINILGEIFCTILASSFFIRLLTERIPTGMGIVNGSGK